MAYTQSTQNIVKNSLFLYFRMLLIMSISIYTSRVVLQTLGVIDYGVFNVVAGFVSMFSVLNSASSASTSRFLSFSLANSEDEFTFKEYFSASFLIHTILAIVVIIIAEILGIWYFSNGLNVPPERLNAAYWVFQISLLTCLISFTQCPYDASIIAHERMKAFAYIGIVEAILKLLIAFLISIYNGDKLIFYAFLYCSVSILKSVIYRIYCVRSFGTKCRLSCVKTRKIYSKLFSYSGWELIGNTSNIARFQGVNLILNAFFGPVVNAARAIVSQIESAVTTFIVGYQNASRPVVIKYYSSGDMYSSLRVLLNTCKFSFYLYSCLAIPIILEAGNILSIWLVEVPEYTTAFLQITMITGFATVLDKSLALGVQAVGDVKHQNIYATSRILLETPIILLLLCIGYSPISTVWILCCSAFIVVSINIVIINRGYRQFHVISYLQMLCRIMLIILLPILIAIIIHFFFRASTLRILCVAFLYCITLVPLVFYFDLSNIQRTKIIKSVKSKFRYIP